MYSLFFFALSIDETHAFNALNALVMSPSLPSPTVKDLALLLIQVLLALLAGLVEPADEPLDVALVLEAGLVLPARGRVVGDVDVAVFAEILFVRDPVFRHGQAG